MTFGGNARKALPTLHGTDIPPQLGHMHFIYGDGGAGKTQLAGTLYDYQPTSDCTFVQADIPGIETLRGRGSQLNWVPIHTYKELVDYCESITETPPGRALVFDHLTKIIYMNMFDKYGPPPWDWKQYGAPVGEIKGLMEGLNTLAEVHHMIIVVIAHDVWETDEASGEKRFELNMSGGFAKAILPIPGYISHLVELPNHTRKLVLQGQHTHAKKRVSPDTVAATIPDEIYNPSFVPILETLWDGKPFPVDKHKKPIPGKAVNEDNQQRVLS